MKIQFTSDLHNEFYDKDIIPIQKNPEADVLVIAGDICKADKVHNNLNFFIDINSKFKRVFYVPGNHEHYSYRFEDTYNKLVRFFNENSLNNIFVLNSTMALEYEGYVFMGDTLWTDAHKDDPITKMTIQRGMNDYHTVRTGLMYRKLNPDDTIREHKKALAMFDVHLNFYKDKKVVLITHHGMSYKSISDKYKDDHYMNGGYVSDLDAWILKYPNIVLNIHGHVHQTFDYKIGTTRVMTNPRGYPLNRKISILFENPNYDPLKVIDV